MAWFELGARFHEVLRVVLISETELSAKHRDARKLPVYPYESLVTHVNLQDMLAKKTPSSLGVLWYRTNNYGISCIWI